MLKLVLVVCLIVFTSTIAISSTIAQENSNQIPYETVNPENNFKYFIKRSKEKLALSILSLFPAMKTSYYESVLSARLSELKYVTDRKDLAHIEKTTQRYAATVGEYVDHILSADDAEDEKNKAKQFLLQHLDELPKYNDNFEDTRAEWRFVEDDVNTLKILLPRFDE